MNGGRAVHSDVGHDTAADPLDDERPETDLDDVPSDEQHDPAPGAVRGGHAGDDRPQVAGGENVGKAGEEGREGTV